MNDRIESDSTPFHATDLLDETDARDAAPADVAVIVPCYNAAATLPDTVASILSQSHERWEAVLVDDGSTDDTPRMLAKFAAADRRIRTVRGPHRRIAAARNHGLSVARADYALFLDADDLLKPDALAVLMQAARSAGPGTIISGGYELLDQRGRPLSIFRFPSVPRFSVDAFLRGNRLPPMTLVPAALLGGDPFDKDPGLRGCEDWALWLRLAHEGARCAVVPRVLFGYRLRADSLSHKVDGMYSAGRRVLERWIPLATDVEATRDLPHRLAFAMGGAALAAGDASAIGRYLCDLRSFDADDGFCAAVADGLHWAYTFVHGAAGRTWRDNAEVWQYEIAGWLADGPLASHAYDILEHLDRAVVDRGDRLTAVSRFIRERSDARRLLIYGLGENGMELLEHLRRQRPAATMELCVADDHADAAALAALDLPRDDPRKWRAWPAKTVAIVTPNNYATLRDTMLAGGGRMNRDFVLLADCDSAVTV